MNLDELKNNIAQQMGVPVDYLTGETEEENIAQAKALLAYKRDIERPESTAEQFSKWLDNQSKFIPF